MASYASRAVFNSTLHSNRSALGTAMAKAIGKGITASSTKQKRAKKGINVSAYMTSSAS